jgi:hypothetical protein
VNANKEPGPLFALQQTISATQEALCDLQQMR